MKKGLLTASLILALLGGQVLAGPAAIPGKRAGHEGAVFPVSRIFIEIRMQKLFLLKNGRICLSTGISTGKPGYDTPRGHYQITEKEVHHISTIYHVAMPYFMRLDGEPFGIHFGYNPGRPASHGCIRVESMAAAQALFSQTPAGTRVKIE